MDIEELTEELIRHLGVEPTADQTEASYRIADFLLERGKVEAFVLRGYAGTGKTTLIKALSGVFEKYGYTTVLLAPTGRAAKVMNAYSGQPAFTIHRFIYEFDTRGDQWHFKRSINKHRNTFFIVDEASMISDRSAERSLSQTSLLEDLIKYVLSGQNCRLFLVGDQAQLPPIESSHSPALDTAYLERNLYVSTRDATLKKVMRQAANSGITANATALRQLIDDGKAAIPKFQTHFDDVIRISDSSDFQEYLEPCMNASPRETIILARGNKRVVQYNAHIRARVHYFEEELSAGDRVMISKNNYFWRENNFIANGDMAQVDRVRNIHEQYGLKFAEATLTFDEETPPYTIETTVCLDALTDPSAGLEPQKWDQLFTGVLEDYADVVGRRSKMTKVKKDPHYQALHLKFAYAITGHKAQGGQWDHVFVEYPYLGPDEVPDEGYLRWLYTAITRAKKKLYLFGFPDEFFEPIAI